MDILDRPFMDGAAYYPTNSLYETYLKNMQTATESQKEVRLFPWLSEPLVFHQPSRLSTNACSQVRLFVEVIVREMRFDERGGD